MLEIQKDEKINNVGIVKRKTKKSQIFLYDTQRRYDNFVMKIKYRNNGKYNDIPHYIILKSGKIVKVFDPNYASKTFGVKQIDNKLIKIAVENLGWLKKNMITGVLYNWIGDPYRGKPYEKKWRDHYFWDPYTKEQEMSIIFLTKYLCDTFVIPFQILPYQDYVNSVIKFNGIVSKSNYANIYCDMNPSFNFNLFYEYGKEKQN